MVQSLELTACSPPTAGTKISGPPGGTTYYTTHHHVHHHLHHHAATGASKIPTRVQPGSHLPSRCSNGAAPPPPPPRCNGSPSFPPFIRPQYPMVSADGMKRMSRQGKPPAPPSGGGGPAVPGAVAQQAQQYLEQNIMAWMQPKTQGQQILSSTLSTFLPSRDVSGGHGSHVSPSQPPMSQKVLQEHNMSQTHGGSRHQLSAMTSPYPPIGGPYVTPSVAGTSCVGLPSSSSIPHSLSFSGYSHHSLLQGTSFSSPCPSTYGVAQPSAAASFFARAAQRLNLSSKKRRRQHHPADADPPTFLTNFCDILRTSPPPAPPCLLRSVGRKESFGIGKVKVMLRISPNSQANDGGSSFLNIDSRKKQVTVYDPSACGFSTPAERRAGVSAPKMFAFDAIFSPDDTQAEVCSSSLPEVIQAVVGGTDGCLFVYGNAKLGKSHTMIGDSESVQDLGAIPCAISWLFRLIHEQRQKTGARFSVRVSAVEVSGRNEVLKDLLTEYAAGTEGSGTSPGVYLRDDPIFGTQLMNQSELRAPSAEKAGYLLDAALASRNTDGDDEGKNSHFLFTLHVYQYRVERGGKGGAGGRSRLHLFDLGSCEKVPPKPRDGTAGGCLTLSALGNVILALFNGQKHVPHKESKLTQLLREAMNSLTCRVAMIAHISSNPSHYSEILGTIQLASRVHRMRRKKLKYPNAGPMESTCDDKGMCRPYIRMHAVSEEGVKSGSSDPDYTSSSEQSCDTVIYVGTGGVALSDRELTDNEGPPSSLPVASKATKTSQNKISMHSRSLEASLESRGTSTSNQLANSNRTMVANEEQHRIGGKNVASVVDASGGAPTSSSITIVPNKSISKDERTSSPQYALNSSNVAGSSLQHQPASTQTPGTEPITAQPKSSQTMLGQSQRKMNVKHRSQAAPSKQDSGGGPSVGSGGQEQQSAGGGVKASTTTTTGSPNLTTGKEGKLQSDEMWIDGPRFSKPKFDSRTLHQLQKEQWVDGPPAMYGFMDDHKQSMIRRWVEEHSQHAHDSTKRMKSEVWIDFPPGHKDGQGKTGKGEGNVGDATQGNAEDVANKQSGREEKVCNKEAGMKDKDVEFNWNSLGKRKDLYRRALHVEKSESEMADVLYENDEAQEDVDNELDDEADSASNSADVDETDNEENAEASGGFDSELHALHLGREDVAPQDFQEALYKAQQVMLEYSQCEDNQVVETIEVMEPDEPVPMMDSCLQVNEEDIIAACWMQNNYKLTENPLPEVDQGSCDGKEHPLRILSEEDLNLPSSFTDSRSVSVDLDSISVPDTCREGGRGRGDVTWRLLYGNMFQKIKEQQQQQRKTMEDLSVAVKSSVLSEKLERIARLKELIRPLTKRGDELRSGASSPTCLTKGNVIPARTSRLMLSEMLYGGSQDSSMEDLSEAEINSTQSEPAELDIDKYDYKFNIKPMNGLKLEAFYNKIHKVPPFLEQYSIPKPTQVVSPLITREQEKVFLLSKMELHRHEMMTLKDQSSRLPQRSSLGRSGRKKVMDSEKDLGDRGERTSSLKKNLITSLRHPDGASNPHLDKHPSMVQLYSEPLHVNTSYESTSKQQRSPGNGASVSDGENKQPLLPPPSPGRGSVKKTRTTSSELNEMSKRTEQKAGVGTLTYKNIDTSQLTVGQSPTNSSKSRLLRNKCMTVDASAPIPQCEPSPTRTSMTSLRSKESSSSAASKLPQKSGLVPSGSLRNTNKYVPNSNGTGCSTKVARQGSGGGNNNNNNSKLPTRSSPTSSSTSGVTTTCCTSMKQKEKVMTMKGKLPSSTHSKQKGIMDSKRAQRAKSICRSTSSPSTCVDSGDTLLTDVTDSDHYHVTRHASVSGALASPYHKLPHVHVSHHHRTSSGHGSDSSVNSIEPREAKELLTKGAKTQQFSGTSSGYESMLRDSEGTPLSSSQESGNEGSVDKGERGRRGTRRKSQGSSKRSQSAPARSPPSPSGQPTPTPVSQQPVATNRACQLRRGDRSLRRSDEEVCCTSLLCCRLLDFY